MPARPSCVALSASPVLGGLVVGGAGLQRARQELQDEEAQQRREVDRAQQRRHQSAEQVQVRVRQLRSQMQSMSSVWQRPLPSTGRGARPYTSSRGHTITFVSFMALRWCLVMRGTCCPVYRNG